MNDQDKTKDQLLAELAAIRQRVAALEEYASERKRVEDELKERREQYRSFVESIPVIAYRGRMDFSVEFFHGAVEEITGYLEHDFTSGKIAWDQVICPEDFNSIQDTVEKICSVPYYSTKREYRILRKDGQTRWIHEVIHNICDSSGRPAYVQGVIFDITNRKRAEEALQESKQDLQEAHDRLEQRVHARTAELQEANDRLEKEIKERREVEDKLHIISDSALDALVMMDPEGKVAHWNPAAKAMFGYSSEEVLGSDLHGRLAAPRHRQQAASGLLQFFKSGQGKAVGQILELQAARKDGSEFPVELSVSRITMDGKWGAVAVIRDITGRKGAEEALRESEENARALINASTESEFLIDPDGTIVMLNEAAAAGFGGLVDELIGQNGYDFMPPDVADSRMKKCEEVVRSGKALRVVDERNGRCFDSQMYPVFDAAGNVVRLAIYAQDITERKNAQDLLRKSEKNARALLNASTEPEMLIETDGTIVTLNPAAAAYFGSTIEEMTGRRAYDFMPPDVADRRRKKTEEVVRSRQPIRHQDEYDGVILDTRLYPVLDAADNVVRLAIYARDITEQKNAEAALRNSENNARALINASTESQFLMDLDSTIVTLNETAAARLESTVEELTGKCGFDLIPPGLVESRGKIIEEVIRSRRAVRAVDERDGRSLDSQYYPVFDTAGNVVRVAIYAHDVTERKKAEEAFLREHNELKRLLEARDHELKVISYEIHDGLAQMLVGKKMQCDVHNQLKSSDPEGAERACKAGQQMVADCLSEVRRLIGRVRLPLLDEEGVLAAVQNLVYESNDKSEAEIEFHSQVRFGRLEPVLENAIYRIVQEGLENARRHSKSKIVRVELVQQDLKVIVEIRDWGVGFNPDDVGEKSFGLGGIRERARLLEGSATIDSTPGKGTSIVVELPMVLGNQDLPEDADNYS